MHEMRMAKSRSPRALHARLKICLQNTCTLASLVVCCSHNQMSEENHEPINASVDALEVHSQKANRKVYWISLTRVNPNDVPMTKPAEPASYDTWKMQMRLVKDELERIKGIHGMTLPDKWVNPFILREEHRSRELTKRGPEEWAAHVLLIGDRVLRAAVARIVWWDFFGHRTTANRWPHLDKYLEGDHVKIDKEVLKRGLYQAGYSPWHAHRRLQATYDYNREGRESQRGHHMKRKQKVNNPFHRCPKKEKVLSQ